jgi:subtilisin family serine protease
MRKFGLFAIGCLTAGLSFAQAVRFEQNTLFVKLNKGAELPAHALIDSSKHLFGDIYELTTEDAVLLENDLRQDSTVVWAEKSFYAGPRDLALPSDNKAKPALAEDVNFNDPQANRVWAFNDASRNGVSVTKAYGELPSRAAKNIIVAVVDTGVDYNHEDLKDVMWVNKKEIAGNGIDDDGNGYTDDIHGINTIDRNADGTAKSDPMDTHSHGTHVSGTIGAKQNNGKGIAGIAANVQIMAIRTVPNSGDETDKNVVESYLYAAKNGAKLINCSFGKAVNEGGMVVSEAIKHIGETYGTLVVAAAGNDSWGPFRWFDIDTNLRYPASFNNEHLMVIAATQSSGGLASFSNVGKVNVDVAAPGQDVFSTTPNNGYQSMSGTSMATPTTVGVAAQVLTYFPKLTALEIKDVIMKSVTPVPAFAGKMVTGGRVDLSAALKYAEATYPNRGSRRRIARQ